MFAVSSLVAVAFAATPVEEADDEKDGISMKKYLECVKHFTEVEYKA